MPEYPDITVYIEALETRLLGKVLTAVRIRNPFLLRTAVPPLSALEGRQATALRRIGKRIAIGFPGELWLVLHLMIAGRLHWAAPGGKPAPSSALAHFEFESGRLTLTEAGSKRRASLHVLEGEAALRAIDPGGLEVMDCTVERFREALTRESHTLKRALTDPRLFSGIGNAYSDEILHAARLSPVALSRRLGTPEVGRLFDATRRVLALWTGRLRSEAAGRFPEKVTAFRPEMAVHGRYGQPCPVCGTAVQRIRYAENEVNYCPRCQTDGQLLADRSLSRLLHEDWPRTIDELERNAARTCPN